MRTIKSRQKSGMPRVSLLVTKKISSIFLSLALVILGAGALAYAARITNLNQSQAEHEIIVNTVAPATNTVGNGENVRFMVQGNTNFADATNVVVSLSVTNAVFDIMPSICKTEGDYLYPVSYISEDRVNMTCNTGDWQAGSSFRIDVTARALGPNGAHVNMEAEVSSDHSNTAKDQALPRTITANFRADIGIYGGTTFWYYRSVESNNQFFQQGEGLAIPIFWRVALERGSEGLLSDGFTANITLSNPTHPDQEGFAGLTALPYLDGCAPLAPSGGNGIGPHTFGIDLNQLQRPIMAAFSNGGGPRANMNSGTCTLTGSGANYTLTVTGMDISMLHRPTHTGPHNLRLPADEIQYASGVALIWVPMSWLAPDGHRTSSLTATVSNFNPVSISGLPNTGERPENNETVFTFHPAGSWWGLWPFTPFYGGTHLFALGEARPSQQDRVIWYPAERNDGQREIMCRVIGHNTTYISTTIFSVSGGVRTNNPDFVAIQYSTAALPALAAYAECNDSDGPWTTIPPADLSTVTRVRAVYHRNFTERTDLHFSSLVRINDNAPVGSSLWSHNNIMTDNVNWWIGVNTGCSTMLTGREYECTNHRHDLATVNGATARITKDTADGSATFSAGEIVDYIINLSTLQLEGSYTSAVVTDTLPAGLELVPGSYNIEPTLITEMPNGETIIIWHLSDIGFNDEREITYQVRIAVQQGVYSLTNSVVVDLRSQDGSTRMDIRPEGNRTATNTINITSDGFVEISKTAESGTIDANDALIYTVRVENFDANTHTFTDIIDVLPFNGDNRNPASRFSGTLDKLSFSSNQRNARLYFTTEDPRTLTLTPHDPSNGEPGNITGNTVGWTQATNVTYEDGVTSVTDLPNGVTAIRAIGEEWTLADGDLEMIVTIERDGWMHGNIFTNAVGISTQSTYLRMLSNDSAIVLYDESLIPGPPDSGMGRPIQRLVIFIAIITTGLGCLGYKLYEKQKLFKIVLRK